MKVVVDAQLPPALAVWLREAGLQADHVEELGLRNASDGAIWRRASATGAAIITKDEDFAARAASDPQAPTIIWLRVGNTTNRELREWIDARLDGILNLIRIGQRLIEVI